MPTLFGSACALSRSLCVCSVVASLQSVGSLSHSRRSDRALFLCGDRPYCLIRCGLTSQSTEGTGRLATVSYPLGLTAQTLATHLLFTGRTAEVGAYLRATGAF